MHKKPGNICDAKVWGKICTGQDEYDGISLTEEISEI